MGFSAYEEWRLLNWYALYVGPTAGAGPQILVATVPRATRVDSLMMTNPDSIAHHVEVSILLFGDHINLGQVTIPIGAGTGAVAPKDLLTVVASPQIGAILLQPGAGLVVDLLEDVTDSVSLSLFATAGEF